METLGLGLTWDKGSSLTETVERLITSSAEVASENVAGRGW